MKQEGEFFEVSMSQLSQMTGFAPRTLIKKLKTADCRPLRKQGQAYIYDTPTALKAIYFTPDKKGGTKKLLDYTQERAKLTREQRKKTKVERMRLELTLVDTTEIKIAYKNLVYGFREKMLAIPPKLANVILTVESKNEAQQMIQKEIETALIELVTNEDFLDTVVGNE